MNIQIQLAGKVGLIILIVSLILVILIMRFLAKVTRKLISKTDNYITDTTVTMIESCVKKATQEFAKTVIDDTPTIRSTGGATKVHLSEINKDFKDFHEEDADTDIQTFILEYLKIKYCGQNEFEKANVSKRVLINFGDKTKSQLTQIKINGISIYDYKKSLNSATILYRVSVGFDLNGKRNEKLYEVEYTLQLRDNYDALTFIKCSNCGATLDEADGVCKYCGAKHYRDTISNWVVTDIREK